MGGPKMTAAARYCSGVSDWPRNTRARCSASARLSASRVGSSRGRLRLTPATSAPSVGWSGVIWSSVMAPPPPLAVVGAAAAIPQPETDEMTLALGLGPITEARTLVGDLAIVEELHLPRLEVEVHAEIRAVHGAVELVEGGLALGIQGHAGQGLSIADLEARQPAVQPARLHLEDRAVRHHGVAGRVLALPVEVERLVESREHLGTVAPDLVVCGDQTHDAAHAAFHGRVQAQESHVLGRAEIVAVVGVEALLRVGDVWAHPVAGRSPRVAHVVDHGAVPLLRHRPGDQRGEQPEEGDGLLALDALERQPVHDGEAGAVREHLADVGHGAPAVSEIELDGIQGEDG